MEQLVTLLSVHTLSLHDDEMRIWTTWNTPDVKLWRSPFLISITKQQYLYIAFSFWVFLFICLNHHFMVFIWWQWTLCCGTPVLFYLGSSHPVEAGPDTTFVAIDKYTWNTVQTISISSNDDSVADGDIAFNVSIAVVLTGMESY